MVAVRGWLLVWMVAAMGCGRYGFSPYGDDQPLGDAQVDATVDGAPIDPMSDWADGTFPYRYRITITNTLPTVRPREPVFLDGSMLAGGNSGPIRESAIRLVCREGATNVDIPFALHDWSTGPAPVLGDADGDFDADDRLLFLVDLPAAGAVDCFVYYDDVDRTPIGAPVVSVMPVGSGPFSRVSVDGVVTSAGALRATDGATTFDLALAPSIPLWNEGSTYTYPSSALGPRIDDLKLPDGTVVMSTANHVGPPTGKLAQAIRLGPWRHDGPFSLLGDNAFFQPHLVDAISHSAAYAWSRPIAAVVVLDTELYCEGAPCVPARDAGDVRMIGYLFDRGDENEVLIRWEVEAVTGGATIATYTATAETEHFSLAGYLFEQYAESDFPAEVDIDTLRWETTAGALASMTFDPGRSGGDQRANAEVRWALMTDSEAPFTGSVALIPEGTPQINGADTTWRAGYWDDGRGITEPNGFQSEWNLYAPGFNTWGSVTGHTGRWAYWIYAFPRPGSGADSAPAGAMRERIATPPMRGAATFETP